MAEQGWERNHIRCRIIANSQSCCGCLVPRLCLTLCDPTDCSPPGSSVHEISQARMLEWVAIPFSRGAFWPRDRTPVSCITRWILNHWATREALIELVQASKHTHTPNLCHPFCLSKNLFCDICAVEHQGLETELCLSSGLKKSRLHFLCLWTLSLGTHWAYCEETKQPQKKVAYGDSSCQPWLRSQPPASTNWRPWE